VPESSRVVRIGEPGWACGRAVRAWGMLHAAAASMLLDSTCISMRARAMSRSVKSCQIGGVNGNSGGVVGCVRVREQRSRGCGKRGRERGRRACASVCVCFACLYMYVCV